MPSQPRDIVMATYTYLAGIMPPTQKISDVRIEELSPLKEDTKNYWKVVLSYDTGEYPFDKKREFKEFKVEDDPINVIYIKSVNDESI
jgi:hypothetical protein